LPAIHRFSAHEKAPGVPNSIVILWSERRDVSISGAARQPGKTRLLKSSVQAGCAPGHQCWRIKSPAELWALPV